VHWTVVWGDGTSLTVGRKRGVEGGQQGEPWTREGGSWTRQGVGYRKSCIILLLETGRKTPRRGKTHWVDPLKVLGEALVKGRVSKGMGCPATGQTAE